MYCNYYSGLSSRVKIKAVLIFFFFGLFGVSSDVSFHTAFASLMSTLSLYHEIITNSLDRVNHNNHTFVQLHNKDKITILIGDFHVSLL